MNATLEIEKEMIRVVKVNPYSLEPMVQGKPKNTIVTSYPTLEELKPLSKMYK